MAPAELAASGLSYQFDARAEADCHTALQTGTIAVENNKIIPDWMFIPGKLLRQDLSGMGTTMFVKGA